RRRDHGRRPGRDDTRPRRRTASGRQARDARRPAARSTAHARDTHMIITWTAGLVGRRFGRLSATALGIALAVALAAALGCFLTASKSTMTARAARSVAVDWQVEVQPGADRASVLAGVRSAPGVRTALPVGFARTTGFQSQTAGSLQSTGPGV